MITKGQSIELAKMCASSDIFSKPNEALSAEEASQVYAFMTFLEGQCKERKKALKPLLKEAAEKQGVLNESSGTRKLDLLDVRVQRIQSRSKNPKDRAFRALLESKGIPIEDAYDKITKLELNPSKVDQLISLGHLEADEVDALKSESTSLRVTAKPRLKAALEGALEEARNVEAEEDYYPTYP